MIVLDEIIGNNYLGFDVSCNLLVFCDHCEEETNQDLVMVNRSRSNDLLLTTYLCKQCKKKNYGTAKRSKFDTKKYPLIPSIPPEKKKQAIKEARNWRPRDLQFKVVSGKYYIGDKYEGKITFESVSKEEYKDEKFENDFQHKLFDAQRSELITFWEFPPKNYKPNPICDEKGHDYKYQLEYVDEFGIDTFPEMEEETTPVFVSSKRGWCSRCDYRYIEVYPDKLRRWLLQRKFM